jgi:hypothetical protein
MKYYILSPWAETGGPEALHQLCSTLNDLGKESFIYYYESNYSQSRRDGFVSKYSEYNLKKSNINNINDLDDKNNVVIVPEVFPVRLIENFEHCKVIFWRLSTYTHGQELNLPIFQKVYQGCQCDTQIKILKDSKLFNKEKYFMLSDYINEIYITTEKNLLVDRKNQVLYNPKKGLKHTQLIIKLLSGKGINFIPITGMPNDQIRDLILDSKVYIDFGDHPGKDRMPRECASGGCVVITGTQRCGANKKDISIQEKFEYNEGTDNYDYRKIGEFILKVLNDYQTYFENQKTYRTMIRREKKTFIKEIQNMISILSADEV